MIKKVLLGYLFLGIFSVFATIIIIKLIICAVFIELEKPYVYYSNSTQQCVKILYPNGKTEDCSSVPKLYKKIWIK